MHKLIFTSFSRMAEEKGEKSSLLPQNPC